MISVLYVDDESALLEVTRVFMERGGEFVVDTATSARETIAKLKVGRYDALVADYQMPEMDGIALLKYLRPRCNGMPFILFTGKGGEEVAIEALNSGADFYIQKKGSPRTQIAELETKIRSAVARRQSEQALRQSEQDYRSLVENLADVVYAVDSEGIITYVSPSIARFGYNPKNLTGKDFATLVCAEDIPSVARHFADVLQGSPLSFEFRITDTSGQSRWVRASCSQRTDQGRVIGGQGLLSEITESKNDDETARRRTDMQRLLLDSATDGMLIIDPETGIPVEFNQEACRQLGYSREEFAHLSLEDREVADAPRKLRESIPAILRTGPITFDTRLRTKDGRIRDVIVTARVLDEGTPKKIITIFHDSTEENEAKRTLAEQAHGFEEVFDQAPLPHLTLSPDGCINDINRAGTALLTCPKNKVIGRSLAEFITPEEQSRFSDSIRNLGQSGSLHAEQFSLDHHDDGHTSVSLEGTAILDSDGKVRQLLVTLTDITGQVKETASLQAIAASAERVIASAREGILVCTRDLIITGWNPAMEDITGIAARDALGKVLADVLPFLQGTGPDSPPARALAGEIVATPDTRYEFPGTKRHGWARSVFSPLRDAGGDITGIIGVVQEITARITAVQRIRAANRLFAISARVSDAATHVRDLETLLTDTCRIVVDTDAGCTAWIGLYDRAAGILRPVSHAGNGEDLAKEGYRIPGNDQEGGLAGEAIRSGRTVICGDTGTDPAAQPWMAEALRHGFRSTAAVPFRFKGEIVGVITLCSGEPDAFSEAESEEFALLCTTLSSALELLDKKTLQRRAGRGSSGSWERTRFLAGGIESAVVPFAAVFPDGSTGAVNAALCSMLGFTEDELLALPLSSLLGAPSADKDRFLQVPATKKPERYESTIRKKDGTNLPIEIFLQAIPDETSGQTCVGMFVTDIAERKRDLDELDKACRQYRSFFETGSAAMLITTPGGRILDANPAACRLLGRTKEDLCSAAGGGFAGTGDPRFVELARMCGQEGSGRGELRLIRGDGTLLDVMIQAALFADDEGKPALNMVLEDITGPKRQKTALLREQEVAEALLDRLPNPVRRSDAGGAGMFFNKAWLAFTGRAPADEEGDGWITGIHPDDLEGYREAIRKQEDSRDPSESEYRLRHHSGEYRWIREIRVPDAVPDETGACATCSCYDIHTCRQAEETLDQGKAQYQAVFENTAEATLLVSDKIFDCNAAAMRLFACTRENLIGHGPFDYSPRYQPDGRVSAVAAQEYLETARRGIPQAFSWVCTRTDGITLETHVTLTALDIHGEQRVLVVINDVTEQNRAEREIQWLASYPEMNPNPVIEVQPDRTITYANPATAVVLSGLGLPDDPAAFLPADFDVIGGTLDQIQPCVTGRVVQLKERSFHESICAVPGYAPFRIYAYDITDRVQAMEALAYANHKLGILTSITRHDIQNKLTGVLGYLDLLRGSLRDPQLIAILEKAESSADAIRHHIDFTRDYESLGGTAPVWQEIWPILADVRSHFDLRGIAFEEPAPGFSVFADPMFAKVLYNLVDNSLRHGVHVRHIRIYSEPSETGCTLIYEDDGAGIPQDKKDLIFERGFTTSSSSEKSSGLGLFLARDILAITGITIKETGVPGVGSRFEMAIPPGKWRPGPAG